MEARNKKAGTQGRRHEPAIIEEIYSRHVERNYDQTDFLQLSDSATILTVQLYYYSTESCELCM